MRYIARTVAWSPERLDNIEKIKLQIPGLEVHIDYYRDWYRSFFEVCAKINDTGAVIFEDDVQLCADFCSKIEAIIQEKGTDKVFNFFEKPKVWFETGYVGGSNFLWMQCIYLPPGLPAKIPSHFDVFKMTKPQRFKGLSVDSFLSYVLVQEGLKYWRIRPSLVQHLDFKSLGGHASGRQTIFFIDDLIKSGVNYEDLRPTK